jgi:Uma2 family endonuclease
VRVADNATLRLDPDNEPHPDALLMMEPSHGGQARIDDQDYVAGAPELVAEVATSSAGADLGPRRTAYERNAVREYLVWRVPDRAVDWFVLRSGQYQPLALTEGIWRSETFPGLALDPAALVRGDLAAVLRVLQDALAGAEHAAFVARLRQRAAGQP